jgi:hypothetical protein
MGSDLIAFYWQERMGAPCTSISVEGHTIMGHIMTTFTSWRIMGKCVTRTPCCLLLFCCRYKSDTLMLNLLTLLKPHSMYMLIVLSHTVFVGPCLAYLNSVGIRPDFASTLNISNSKEALSRRLKFMVSVRS